MKAFTPIALRESRLKNGIGLRSRRGLSPAKEFGYGEWGYLVVGYPLYDRHDCTSYVEDEEGRDSDTALGIISSQSYP